MSRDIKSGFIGGGIGVLVSLATMFLTAGTYKEKVDQNGICLQNHDTRLDLHDAEISAVKQARESDHEILLEIRAGQKEVIKKLDWN